MKKFLLGTVALAALAVPATAADMGVRPRAVAYVPAFSWTGCHVGGLVGYGWGRNDGWATNGATTFVQNGFPNTRFAAGIPVTNGFSMDGFVGGGDVGCDYQFGAWVVGVEADWSNANIAGQAPVTPQLRAAAAALNININPTRFWESHEHWLATARARFGYAVDHWLFFASGGGAWTRIDSSEWNTVNPTGTSNLQSDTRTGWTVGAGVEYAPPQLNGPFNGQWTIRAEYLYVRFNSYNTFTPGVGPAFFGNGQFVNLDSGRIQDHIVRFGLAYKFGNFLYAAR